MTFSLTVVKIVIIPWNKTSFVVPLVSAVLPLFSMQNIIAEHEIRNISCAAQDPEDLCTFAYITKDLQTSHHYCHVFSTVDVVRTHLMVFLADRLSSSCLLTGDVNYLQTALSVGADCLLIDALGSDNWLSITSSVSP